MQAAGSERPSLASYLHNPGPVLLGCELYENTSQEISNFHQYF